MNEENKKLLNVKKSCKAAKVVSLVLFIIATVATVLTLVAGIVLLTNSKYFNDVIQDAVEAGDLQVDVSSGPFIFANVDLTDMDSISEIEKDLPGLGDFVENGEYAIIYGCYFIGIAFAMAVLAVAFKLIHSVFNLIAKEDTPFSKKVIKRILIVMIVISVLLAFTVGAGAGLVGGFITWVIYTIMDYGRILQIQSDETL